jgi:SAM-dependent methyltransferase
MPDALAYGCQMGLNDGPPTDGTMDPSHILQSYDLVAEPYARKFAGELQHKPFDRLFLDGVAAKLRGRGTVVELGCGPGHVAAYLHERGVDVTGTDLSSQMVAQAQGLFPAVPFRTLDMLRLDLPDGSLCGLVAFYAIVNFELAQVDTALREMRRVLIPGGLLAMSFHAGQETHHVEELLGCRVSMDFQFFDPADMEVRLNRAGLVVDEMTVRPPYPEEYPSNRAYILARA